MFLAARFVTHQEKSGTIRQVLVESLTTACPRGCLTGASKTFKDGQGMAGIAKDMKWGHLMIFLNTFKIKTNGDVCRYLRFILVSRSCHKGEDM